MAHDIHAQDILDFWFSDRVSRLWFNSTAEFDAELSDRFLNLYMAAKQGLLLSWQESAAASIALVIILDQFPLNMFRNRAEAYATEAQARAVARHAIAAGFDQHMPDIHKVFLYLPFMHSEDLSDQDYSIELFTKSGLQDNLKYAHHHRDIIKRFGRFPHRNQALGRTSTAEELAYLDSDGAFHG